MSIKYAMSTKRKKSLIVAAVPLFFTLFYQCFWIWTYGDTISMKGWAIFVLEISLYILNLFWILPELYDRKKYALFLFTTLGAILFYILMKIRIITSGIWTQKYWDLMVSSDQWRFASLQILLILGISYMVGFYRNSERNFIEKEAVLKANMKNLNEMRRIETTSYQLQLNPHFTFNVLNRIRLQTQEQLPHVSDAAHLLATILRHSLVDPIKTSKVDVASEIKIVEDFITIQQFLANNTLFIDYRSQIDTTSLLLEIPPGILITLADNLFKYGVTNEADYAAQFSIVVTEGYLRLRSWNYKSLHVLSGTGVGLKNVSSILEYYYQDKFKLEIDDREDTYELTLEIEL